MAVVEAVIRLLLRMAANTVTDAVKKERQKELERVTRKRVALRDALASRRNLRDEVAVACVRLAQDRYQVSSGEEPLWRLLTVDAFQVDLTEWIASGAMEEGAAVKARLVHAMRAALQESGAATDEIPALQSEYFESIERMLASNSVIANWRHSLTLEYLRDQVTALKKSAEEARGIYPVHRQESAIRSYCEKALSAWDIIDLSNLPEGDVHMVTQKLLLRQLYMPLRVTAEIGRQRSGQHSLLRKFERMRSSRRLSEAGHLQDLEAHSPTSGSRAAVGERLVRARRLVILGDPGGGKTTLLRWMATAYILRFRGDEMLGGLPDVATLPRRKWLPILIRCRDLGEADLCRSFPEFLAQQLRNSELLPEDAAVMSTVILGAIAEGEALLLVDGLDEITHPNVRVLFCQELERTAVRYPKAHIVVTSRIVGYRDMPYRMGKAFEHAVIAELTQDDKALFAQRWVEVTEQHLIQSEKRKRTQELLDALSSSDRIRRLAGNPMLLTTLALVKRKVGKLPSRRTRLYEEAVAVLLNWNPCYYQAIDEEEAIPQLEYVAYEMCRRGIQRVSESELLALLDRVRGEYPHVRPIRRRDSEVFLKLLEARSSILIRSGGDWRKNRHEGSAVWEFRHLTFQEYLAARALIDGRYPDRDRTKSLAEQVAPLAGSIRKIRENQSGQIDFEVTESWLEALRLLVAACNDDDVDATLLAILTPLPAEDVQMTARARAVLAARCLADEPNVSERVASEVLAAFSRSIRKLDGFGFDGTSAARAAVEVAMSQWGILQEDSLATEYLAQGSDDARCVGGLLGLVLARRLGREGIDMVTHLSQGLNSRDEVQIVTSAFGAMHCAYDEASDGRAPKAFVGLAPALLAILQRRYPLKLAAAWALVWLNGGWLLGPEPGSRRAWIPTASELEILLHVLESAGGQGYFLKNCLITLLGAARYQPACASIAREITAAKGTAATDDLRAVAAVALGRLRDRGAVEALTLALTDRSNQVRTEALISLRELRDPVALDSILVCLKDSEEQVRRAAIRTLIALGDPKSARNTAAPSHPNTPIHGSPVDKTILEKAAAPLLNALSNDASEEIRISAGVALARLGSPRAVEVLTQRLVNSDPSVRRESAEALQEIKDERACEALIRATEDTVATVRLAAVEALVEIGHSRMLEVLLPRLEDNDPNIRSAASQALGRLGDRRAIEPLLALLDNTSLDTRLPAAGALSRLGEEQGVTAIQHYLKSPLRRVRTQAVASLASCQPQEIHILMSRDLDSAAPYLDPKEPICSARIELTASRLHITAEAARARYSAIAATFGLRLEALRAPTSSSPT